MFTQRAMRQILLLIAIVFFALLCPTDGIAEAINGEQNAELGNLAAGASNQNSNAASQYLDGCKSGYASHQIVTMIVSCIKSTFQQAASFYVAEFTAILAPTIGAIFAFSIMVLGIKVVGGVQELNKEVLLYMVKFGIVFWFVVSMPDFALIPFDIVEYLSTLVVGGYAPWERMDLVFCKFFGTGCTADNQLQNGLTSLVQAAMFSGIQGILIAVLSILATVTIIYFIFRAIHTYLASISLIAFIMILAPLMIPLAIFGRTSRYTYKWIDYLIAAMLHPVILFAFLYQFEGVILAMLDWFTYDLIGGTDFSQHWRNNQNFGSWLLNADPRTVQQLESVLGAETGRTAVHSFVSPSMLSAVEANPIKAFSLDFGANQVWAMQILVFGFLGLFITSYLMLSMINFLPRISEAIAGVAVGLEVQGIPFVSEMRHMFSKLKGAIGGG